MKINHGTQLPGSGRVPIPRWRGTRRLRSAFRRDIVQLFSSHPLDHPPTVPVRPENVIGVRPLALPASTEALALGKGDVLQQLVSDLLRRVPVDVDGVAAGSCSTAV